MFYPSKLHLALSHVFWFCPRCAHVWPASCVVILDSLGCRAASVGCLFCVLITLLPAGLLVLAAHREPGRQLCSAVSRGER